MEHHAACALRLSAGDRDSGFAIGLCSGAHFGNALHAAQVPNPGTITVWSLATVLLVLALGAAMFAILARHRRLITELSARLDAVENPQRSRDLESSPETSEPGDSALPCDVLHGHTSYVRAMIGGADSGAKSLADQVILAIHDRLEDPISPRHLAATVNVSVRTLERVLQGTLGCSPRQLILTMKMREAQRLLCTNELRVGEIAYRLGFSSAAHFSTRFRGFSGTTPTAFQRSAIARGLKLRDRQAPMCHRNADGH